MKKQIGLFTAILFAVSTLMVGCKTEVHTHTFAEEQTSDERFVLISAGNFQMGSEKGESDNKLVHEVTITKPFYMGKYEVTQEEYEKYCSYGNNSPSAGYGVGDNFPAYFVS